MNNLLNDPAFLKACATCQMLLNQYRNLNRTVERFIIYYPTKNTPYAEVGKLHGITTTMHFVKPETLKGCAYQISIILEKDY